MIPLDPQQKQRAIETLKEYLAAQSSESDGLLYEFYQDFDRKRRTLIEQDLFPLVSAFLKSEIRLAEFKSRVDSINKKNELWGFKGIKGQMFFNMLFNAAVDEEECAQEIQSAIALPESNQIASSRIKTFTSYVKRVGDDVVESGQSKHRRPKAGSVPYFLSYFWQIQDPINWPIYYTSSVQAMIDLNIWQLSDDVAADYVAFKQIQFELIPIFTSESNKQFDLYGVEHVFWFKSKHPFASKRVRTGGQDIIDEEINLESETVPSGGLLPESYIPPVVSVLPAMARRDPVVEAAAKKSGTNLDRAFEKCVDAAFTILGYETKLLGQGQGRVPDGIALAQDDSYAMLWDGKTRSGSYMIGTDNRTISEYITTQSRELKRRRSYRNIYYVLVSHCFGDDFDDLIRTIKMETDVNEVVLLEAEALVAMVDKKIRSPLETTLGPDGIQRLFSNSGILSADDVREYLM